jgi:hypothetical protein
VCGPLPPPTYYAAGFGESGGWRVQLVGNMGGELLG